VKVILEQHDDVDDVLGFDAMYTGRQMPAFGRNIPLPSSEVK
jgi:hypothetical protein